MKIASQRPIPTSARSPLPRREIHRPFGIKNLQIPLSRLSTHIDFYFMYFQVLTNPFSTNPFLSTSIQNPRGVHAPRPLRSELSALGVADFCKRFCYQQLAASCFLFALFFTLLSFIFNRLQPLCPKQGGGGTPPTVGQPFLPAGCSRGCPPWIHRSIRHHYQAAER